MSKSFVLLFFSCLIFCIQSHAQPKLRGCVKGFVIDSSAKQALSEATVSLTPEADTTNAEFVITDKHGAFFFRNLEPGRYQLLITFEGFHHITKIITINATTKDIDLTSLYMQKASDML